MCPGGGLQECITVVNNARTWRRIKWAIWIPWLGLIAFLAVRAGGYLGIDPLLHLAGGVTMAISRDTGGASWYLVYYIIVVLMTLLPLAVGRPAMCHTLCWMVPFMILERRIRNLVRSPPLRLQADACPKDAIAIPFGKGCPGQQQPINPRTNLPTSPFGG